MKFWITSLLLFTNLNLFSQSVEEVKLAKTIREFHKVLIAGNTVSLNQQTDKALSYGHSNGWVETKNEMIKNLETGYLRYKNYKEDSLSLTINGNMANARFIADIDAVLNGKEASYHLKVLEVWVRKGSRWLLFARQAVK